MRRSTSMVLNLLLCFISLGSVVSLSLCGVAAMAQDSLGSTECNQQILLYMDVSGSMQPKTPGAPYRQTLEAIRLVLDVPGFLGPEDELMVVPFGDKAYTPARAQGQEGIRNLLDELTSQPKSDSFSDFNAVLKHLVSQSFDDLVFQSQVVIIASDFVHEPSSIKENKTDARFLASWSVIWPEYLPNMQRIFAKDKARRLVLFKAKPKVYQNVGDKILQDFQAIVGAQIHNVGDGTTDAAQNLATAIRNGFLFDLIIDPRPDMIETLSGVGLGFHVEVTNLNCRTLRVEELVFQCLDANEKQQGSLIRIPPLPPDADSLSATGTVDAKRTYTIPRETLTCGSGIQDYGIQISTKPRAQTTWAKASFGNKIDYKPIIASREWYFAGNTLRVYVDLSGQTLNDTNYTVRVLHPFEKKEIATGVFEAPVNLHRLQPKPFLLVFPGVSSGDLKGADSVLIQIEQQNVLSVPIESLDFATVQTILALIVIAILMYWFSRDRQPTHMSSLGLAVILSDGAAFIFLLLIQLSIQLFLPGGSGPQSLPWLAQSILFGGILGTCTFIGMRQQISRRIDKELFKADMADMDGVSPGERMERIEDLLEDENKPLYSAIGIFLVFLALSLGLAFWQSQDLDKDLRDARVLVVKDDLDGGQ